MREFVLLIILTLLGTGALADERGLHRTKLHALTQTGESLKLYKESHALLIGVSDYSYWPKLESIPGELDEVEQTLISQDFNVVRMVNPKGRELSNGIEDFINQYGYEPENRLLIYFSGHGHSIGNKGFLLPADVPLPGDKTFRRELVPMSRVLSWARDMESKHVLFLFDSCFSGAVFSSRNLPNPGERYVRQVTAQPVRQFITAGGANQEVPAKSTFTPAFVRAIKGDGDLNDDGYITGSELGVHLSQLVPQYVDQTPQYGKIKDYELAQGDFVFFKQDIQPQSANNGGNNNMEALLWQSAERGNNVEEYQAYLDEFPTGTFAKLASARIKRLSRSQPGPAVGRLTVQATPIDARIRIMNIKPIYRAGIELPLGENYDILVTKKGYKSKRRWVRLTEPSQSLNLKLEQLAANPTPVKPKLSAPNKLDPRVTKLHKECDMGNAFSCGYLGYRYRKGNGVKKDLDIALALSTRACEGGSGDACGQLGYMYREGIGVEIDVQHAFQLAKKGCDIGSASACGGVGFMYRQGIAVKKDIDRAFSIINQACADNSASACSQLAHMYRHGHGVDKDKPQALTIARKGCDGGDANACREMKQLISEGVEAR